MWLVLFDCDGTLVDSQAVILQAMREAFQAVGLKAPGRERLLRVTGCSRPQAMHDLTHSAAQIFDDYPALLSYLLGQIDSN